MKDLLPSLKGWLSVALFKGLGVHESLRSDGVYSFLQTMVLRRPFRVRGARTRKAVQIQTKPYLAKVNTNRSPAEIHGAASLAK